MVDRPRADTIKENFVPDLKTRMVNALRQYRWEKDAAVAIGMTPRQFAYHKKKFGIEKPTKNMQLYRKQA